MPAIYHEGSWLGNATDPEVLVKDTVGWTGKNLADNSKTISMGGASTVFSLNDNGGFSLSGSIRYLASLTPLSNLVVGEQYIASIKVVSSTNSDARLTLRDSANQIQTLKLFGTTPGVYELPFTYQAGWYLSVICNFAASQSQSSMEIEEIMVRKADITDPTYEPYHESVQNQLNAQGVLGAKNLMKNNATSQTINGVTFTVNADGSVIANGTATANIIDYFINKFTSDYFPYDTSKEYILSGCPAGGSSNGYKLDIVGESGIVFGVDDMGNGAKFQFPKVPTGTERFSARIRIGNGTVCNNLVFKPMLRLASDPDDTYQPYTMTNRELTEKRFEKGILSSGDDLNNITETGIYLVATSVSNVPENRANLTLIVNGFDSTQIRQVLMTREAMYTRSKEGATWKPWYKYTGTVVS